jgi:hypothetical protein
VLVKSVVDRLSEGGSQVIIQLEGAEENVTFALPKALQG